MTQEDKPTLAQQKSSVSSDSDLLLMSLIDLLETFDKASSNEVLSKLSITLFVQGSIVSGFLIGEKHYFEALNNESNNTFSSGSDEGKKAMGAFLAPFQSFSTALPDNQGEQNAFKDREFIYLKDAKFLSGNSLNPHNKGVYWRGRLSRVDGFFIGNLSPGN